MFNPAVGSTGVGIYLCSYFYFEHGTIGHICHGFQDQFFLALILSFRENFTWWVALTLQVGRGLMRSLTADAIFSIAAGAVAANGGKFSTALPIRQSVGLECRIHEGKPLFSFVG